jgi:HEPN domain-containing protein
LISKSNQLAHAWLRKAEAAYSVAKRATNVRRKPLLDHACIWSEQAAAWYLVGLLAKRNERYSHDQNVMSLIKKS